MPGDTGITATNDVNRIEAPITFKTYMMCAFASFGGMFFGYDSGYINGVTGASFFIHLIDGPDAKALTGPHNSLIVSILSAGTFFGAVAAGDVADIIGRKWTVITGCAIYAIGKQIDAFGGEFNVLIAMQVLSSRLLLAVSAFWLLVV
jgi:MFS family permease